MGKSLEGVNGEYILPTLDITFCSQVASESVDPNIIAVTEMHQSVIPSTVADPGFPVGGRRPPMLALFGKNICKNERIGSCWGGGGRVPAAALPPGSANVQNQFHFAIHMYSETQDCCYLTYKLESITIECFFVAHLFLNDLARL